MSYETLKNPFKDDGAVSITTIPDPSVPGGWNSWGSTIDVHGKYLKFLEPGILIVGHWVHYSGEGHNESSFQVGKKFIPWHQIEDIADVYDSAEEAGIDEWGEAFGLNSEEIQRAGEAFSRFN